MGSKHISASKLNPKWIVYYLGLWKLVAKGRWGACWALAWLVVGRHTTTTMGSGHFAGEWYKKASYFRKVMTVDGANTLREAENLHPGTDNDNCYSVKEGQSGSSYWGTHFFYGGPGRNAKCPWYICVCVCVKA